jgi:acetyl esterase/lipase
MASSFELFGRGVRALVRARRRWRGPARPSWDEDFETLATILHHYSKRSTLLPLELQRRAAHTLLPAPSRAVREARCEPADAGGVPACWFRRADADPERVLLYLHGGGYSIGSVETHRDLIARLCRAAGVTGMAIDYRLAPEHRFPAQLDDALAAYRALLGLGFAPERIAVGGESAGGGLTVALLLALRDRGSSLPAAAFVISPWVDLEARRPSIRQNARWDYISEPVLRDFARRFVREHELRHPLAAPIHADLAGLPPLLVHAGAAEALLDDARDLAARARDAGVEVRLDVWPDMIHAWHVFAPRFESGRRAIEAIGAFVRERLGMTATQQ